MVATPSLTMPGGDGSVDGERVLLSVRNLRKFFPIRGGLFSSHIGDVRAVDGVSFTIHEGETVGLVGESGCGKTTVGRLLLRLIEPTSGHAFYRPTPEILQRIEEDYREIDLGGTPAPGNGSARPLSEGASKALRDLDQIANQYSLFRKRRKEVKALRGRLQIVFQDPFSSLEPRLMVRDIIAEPLDIQHVGTRAERMHRVDQLLQDVGLSPEHAWRFPHEFSGGQRQRIGIARALALRPEFIVLDEPTSALDVSVQAQVLNILRRLQQEQRLAYLFISHHLSVIRAVSDRVVVMYLGRIVERAETDELFSRPLHPYTQALLSAIPIPDPLLHRERIILSGDVPSPADPPSGCHFHTRCPAVMPICSKVSPPLAEVRPGHWVSCHLFPPTVPSGAGGAVETLEAGPAAEPIGEPSTAASTSGPLPP
jgi:peptide/nickel transport system ATP-binding protein/oligopeptide transport system ATP-binding protein